MALPRKASLSRLMLCAAPRLLRRQSEKLKRLTERRRACSQSEAGAVPLRLSVKRRSVPSGAQREGVEAPLNY